MISPYGFGWAECDGVGRYTNDQLIRSYNDHGFMGSPTNSDIYAHFAGQTTLYFWADGRKGTPLTLSNIDIDCHGRGNPRSAAAFAARLRENDFPNLYHARSTHGTGRHGYFVLHELGYGDKQVAAILKILDKAPILGLSTRSGRIISRLAAPWAAREPDRPRLGLDGPADREGRRGRPGRDGSDRTTSPSDTRIRAGPRRSSR